jgi:uncharacterized protein (DUF1800 family)
MKPLSERQKIAHLLRRFGLGASEAELEFYGKGGLAGAIDKLLNFDSVNEDFVYEIDNLMLEVNTKVGKVKNLNPRGTQVWWYTRLLTTQRPLEQKMTVFWHNHFATSAAKVESGEAMYKHLETLRTHAFGRFEDLLLAISHDPAMLYWLDNGDNEKGKPNENFAREVMELFTLGIGNYTEMDIQEAARAFTGWRYGVRRPNGRIVPTKQVPRKDSEFVFEPSRHDTDIKTVLGNTGQFNGEDICGILVGKPRTAEFLTRKIWEWFVYENPSDAVIKPLADKWHRNGMVIKDLLADIMRSPEFYSERSYRKLVKNPIDFAIAPARQLGIGQILRKSTETIPEGQPKNRALGPSQATLLATKSMGMELVYPPDVSGWRTGPGWISSATMLERIKWADMLLNGGPVAVNPNGKRVARTNAYPAAGLFDDISEPLEAAKKIVSVFDAEIPDSKLRQLAAAASAAAEGRPVTPQNANLVADSVARLLFGSPEFQFC